MTGRIHSYNDEYFGSVWNYFSFSLLFFSLAPSFVLICTHLNFFFNFFFLLILTKLWKELDSSASSIHVAIQ